MIVPPLVARAEALAATRGFERSCIPGVGALLHVLAARRGLLRAAEIGAGCGVGSAWIVSALAPGTPFFTVELDEERAAGVAELFAEDPDVTVLAGDWYELLPSYAPFDLLFLDATKQQPERNGELVAGLLAPGGTLVVDDLTPGRPGLDPVRSFWLDHPRFVSVELMTTPTTAVIVATRK